MIWLYIACLILGFGLGVIALGLRVRPKLNAIEQINEKTRQENEENEQRLLKLLNDIQEQEFYSHTLKDEILLLKQQKDNTQHSIDDLKLQAETASKIIYDQAMETMQLQLEQSAEREREKFEKAKEEYLNEYQSMLSTGVEEYNTAIANLQYEKVRLETSIADARSIADAAIAANKRAYEIQQQSDFYKLNLTENDLNEIKKLKDIIPYLRDPEALNKVIWKIYYEKPYTDLIGRVVGTGVKTGIYKITNTINQMCYVGQAVNIADRWKQHIKRGIGAETPTKNKLYPAMLKDGVENFTFELIEECDRSLLNDREDYWQEYFKAKEFGYSIK